MVEAHRQGESFGDIVLLDSIPQPSVSHKFKRNYTFFVNIMCVHNFIHETLFFYSKVYSYIIKN